MKAPPFRTFFPAVLILTTMGAVATDIYLPSLPSVTKALDTSNALAQITLTIFLLTYSLSQLLYGPFSDRFGRRRVVIVGLVFSYVGSFVCVAAPSIEILLLGRALQGLALGSGAALARAILRDVYEGEQLAKVGSLIPIGTSAMLAGMPTLGGFIEHYLGWRANFVFILLYTTLAITMVLFWLPETIKQKNPHATKSRHFFRNYFQLLKNPIFIGYTACSTLAFAGLLSYLTTSPFLFQDELKLSPIEYGWLAFVIGGGIIGGGYCNSVFLKRFNRHQMLFAGTLLMLLSSVMMLIPALLGKLAVVEIMVPMFVYAFGISSVFSNSFASALHPFPHMAGFAAALFGCIQMLGGSIGTLVSALVPETTQLPLSLILGAVALLTLASQWYAHKKFA